MVYLYNFTCNIIFTSRCHACALNEASEVVISIHWFKKGPVLQKASFGHHQLQNSLWDYLDLIFVKSFFIFFFFGIIIIIKFFKLHCKSWYGVSVVCSQYCLVFVCKCSDQPVYTPPLCICQVSLCSFHVFSYASQLNYVQLTSFMGLAL